MNIYVKDSQISADLSTLSATGKAQKSKKFFVDLLMARNTPVIVWFAREILQFEDVGSSFTKLPVWMV